MSLKKLSSTHIELNPADGKQQTIALLSLYKKTDNKYLNYNPVSSQIDIIYEPFSGLDPVIKKKQRQLLQEIYRYQLYS